MAKVLLINPSYRDSYGSAKASLVDPIYPTLGLLTIAAMAEKFGHKVEVLDLSYQQYDYRTIKDKILSYKPDVVGITGTTPLMNQIRDISVLVKSLSSDILCIAGGPHVSALPNESMLESMLDAVVVGEGELTFAELVSGRKLSEIAGIYYRESDGTIKATRPRAFIENLDELPFPSWHLFDAEFYKDKVSRLFVRTPPLARAEFSRGCVYKCDFCASKNTVGWGYRKKSPERCAEEVMFMYKHGWREFALADDIFTSDKNWASAVSDAICKLPVKMLWTASNGIRVESADDELFRKMRKSGCYRVAFGLESGSDEVLKTFGKGGHASVSQARKAVQLARKHRMDVTGFFMLGLSPDTEKTMTETIEFARQIPLDMMKFGMAIAFPGTKMFKDYREKGLIQSYNWDDYFIYTGRPLFAHPNLPTETIKKYMNYAWKRALLMNPSYIVRRLFRGIRTRQLFWDFFYFLRFVKSPTMNTQTHSAKYFAQDKWPVFDFVKNQISFFEVRKAKANSSSEPETVASVKI